MARGKVNILYSLKICGEWMNVTGRKKNKAGYILLCIHDHPNSDRNGHIFEHRVVVEMYCGRFLKSGEDVHHKNEIKHDNRIENLEIISHSEHTILHNLGSVQSGDTRRKISDKAKKRFSNKKNHPLYKDVDDELIEMIKDGKKPTEISKKLNITRKTVYNKIDYLNLRSVL